MIYNVCEVEYLRTCQKYDNIDKVRTCIDRDRYFCEAFAIVSPECRSQ